MRVESSQVKPRLLEIEGVEIINNIKSLIGEI